MISVSDRNVLFCSLKFPHNFFLFPEMRQIVGRHLKFSEGPVFDKNGKFFMVDAYSWDPKNISGYVLSVNLHTGKVSCSS